MGMKSLSLLSLTCVMAMRTGRTTLSRKERVRVEGAYSVPYYVYLHGADGRTHSNENNSLYLSFFLALEQLCEWSYPGK